MIRGGASTTHFTAGKKSVEYRDPWSEGQKDAVNNLHASGTPGQSWVGLVLRRRAMCS